MALTKVANTLLDFTGGFVAGNVSFPAITTVGDTNTGIFFPAADTIAFAEGGAECARFDSSGNFGVGTVSPSVKFEVSGTAVAVSRISSSQTSPNNILMTGGLSYNYGVMGVNTGNNTSTGDIFQLGYTASAGAAPTSILQWSSAAKCIGLNTNPATSGTGITFPATQSASSDANTLDDYEEGTYTATSDAASNITSVTFTSARYVKIGRLVTVWIQGTASITSSGVKAYFTVTAPFPQASNSFPFSGNAFFESSAGVYATGSSIDASSNDSRAACFWGASAITFTGSSTFVCGFVYEST